MAEATLSESSSPLGHITRLGKAVGDSLRAGVLVALREDSFTVSELCELFTVPQPALSHHLKILHQAGLVATRREGNSIFYRREAAGRDPIKQALFDGFDRVSPEQSVIQGMARIHERRRRQCREFFARHASGMAAKQTRISEPKVYTDTVIEMIQRSCLASGANRRAPGGVLEVGPGDGLLLPWLAEHFHRATGIDSSAEMLAQAAARTRHCDNVELHHADYLDLDIPESLDLIVAAMVVHHLPGPSRFFTQAARLLEAGGSLIVAELCRHDQQWTASLCGDLWLGFEPQELTDWAHKAGMRAEESEYLAQKNGFRIQIQRFARP
jgi:ArsR family transcriptional regulator